MTRPLSSCRAPTRRFFTAAMSHRPVGPRCVRSSWCRWSGSASAGADCPQAISLGAADVPEILDLVAATEPGPFLKRTVELGDYLGIRRDSALVAMAGERLRFDGWTEISGVCTLASHRGQGLASQLVGALIAGMQQRSQRPFLHVLRSNTSAIRLYEELGFRARRSATITVMAPEPGRTR